MTTIPRPARKRRGNPSRKTKLAITLPAEQVAAAKQAVAAGKASSVSAFISRALDEHADTAALSRLIATMRAEDGAPSADDYAWADAALNRSGRHRRSDSG